MLIQHAQDCSLFHYEQRDANSAIDIMCIYYADVFIAVHLAVNAWPLAFTINLMSC